MTTPATIRERGNGLPDVGDYVSGDDENIYRVVSLDSHIHTGGPGQGNFVHGQVELADWDDVDIDSEPVCTAELEDDLVGYSCHG